MTFFNHLNPDTPEHRSLSRQQAAHLLSIGVLGPRRPVDDLIACLRREVGHDWVERTIAASLKSATGRAPEDLLEGRLSLDELRAAKDAAKDAMSAAAGREAAAGAVALYFVAIAGALAHHGELITSREREQLTSALVDLAEALPDRWRTLVETALRR